MRMVIIHENNMITVKYISHYINDEGQAGDLYTVNWNGLIFNTVFYVKGI